MVIPKVKSSPSPISGFTLTELMLVVAVAGVLAILAMPSFTSLTQSQRVKNATFEMYALFNVARSEAIKRNADVTITPVMAGAALDRIQVTAADGTVLYVKSAPNGVEIKTDAPGITYQRTGRTTAAGSGATFDIDVKGSATPSNYARCIALSLSGAPTIRKGACT